MNETIASSPLRLRGGDCEPRSQAVNQPENDPFLRLSDEGGASEGEPYDALTDLFLGEVETVHAAMKGPVRPPDSHVEGPKATTTVKPPAEKQHTAPAAHLDLVLVGHLPVLSSAWVREYARRAAETDGAHVALVRVSEGQTIIDFFQGEGLNLHAPDSESFEHIVRSLSHAGCRWIIRADAEDLVDGIITRAMSGSQSISVTLLTGADDAAIVEAYRMIKQGAAMASTADLRSVSMRVQVMGSPPERAAAAGQRLAGAASDFLGQRVTLLEPVANIRAGRAAAPLFAGHSELTTTDALSLIMSAAPTAPNKAPAVELKTIGGGRSAPPPANPIPTASISERQNQSAAPERSSAVPLAAHLPNLQQTAIRCPLAAGVEYAIDAEGRWHLLAHDGAGAIENLMVASAWTATHGALLSMAAGAIGHNAGRLPGTPTLHLFTEQAGQVRKLLDIPVSIHMLARTGAERVPGWLCADLN